MTHNGYDIIALGQVTLRHENDAALEQRLAANAPAIDEAWRHARQHSGKVLFNGSLLVHTGHREHHGAVLVTGHFAEYKQYIAHRARPELGLDITPIGVSGLVTGHDAGGDYVVFARRAPDMSTYGGRLELLPSGAIDSTCAHAGGVVDYKAKILEELSEESAPLPPGALRAVRSFALVLDKDEKVFDVCCHISVSLDRSFFIDNVPRSREYGRALCVPLDQLPGFVAENHDDLIPTTLAVTRAFSMI